MEKQKTFKNYYWQKRKIKKTNCLQEELKNTLLFNFEGFLHEKLSRNKLKLITKNISWIFPYNELLGIFDSKSNLIELIEDYAPANGLFGEAWRTLHFPQTSKLVVSARREGTKSIFRIKPGKTKLQLAPTFAPIGIEAAAVSKKEIKITYSGWAEEE